LQKDYNDVAMTTEFILRLFIAAMLGGIIGLEREYRAKEAGFRTHFLVALGSALFMILSEYGFNTVLSQLNHASFDPSRIASQVVTGIGFIGAGTIIFQKHVVRGLTTAAGLWVTSAIGMTCGTGMYALSVAATILVLICLEALNMILHKFGTRSISVTFSSPSRESIKNVLLRMKDENSDIDTYNMQERRSSAGDIFVVTMEVKVKRVKYEARILDFMNEFDGVTIENIE
jgi:putative Mg2+ transporter-C (MgtC) family protein